MSLHHLGYNYVTIRANEVVDDLYSKNLAT